MQTHGIPVYMFSCRNGVSSLYSTSHLVLSLNPPVTNEVQSATITFLNTTVSLTCVFTATGSATACRFTLTLASGDSETLDIPRPEGGGLVQMCATTQNNRFIPLFFLSPSFPFSPFLFLSLYTGEHSRNSILPYLLVFAFSYHLPPVPILILVF